MRRLPRAHLAFDANLIPALLAPKVSDTAEDGGWLLLSDSPEKAAPGILWRTLIASKNRELNLRLWLYHFRLSVETAVYLSAIVYNSGKKEISCRLDGTWRSEDKHTQVVLDWAGQVAGNYLEGAFNDRRGRHTILPGTGVNLLRDKQILPGKFFHGIYDLRLSGASPPLVQVIIAASDQPITNVIDQTYLNPDPRKANILRYETHPRGTYQFSRILKTVMYLVSQGARRVVITPKVDDGAPPFIERHRDGGIKPQQELAEPRGNVIQGVFGPSPINTGNYGVQYHIRVSINNDQQNQYLVFVYLAGGYYGGALKVARSDGTILRAGTVYQVPPMGERERDPLRSPAFLEKLVVEPRTSSVFEIVLMHAAGSVLPVHMVLIPRPWQP